MADENDETIPEQILKTCNRCEVTKPLIAFGLAKRSGTISYRGACRDCVNSRLRQQRQDPKVKAQLREYWRANKDKKAVINARYKAKDEAGEVKLTRGANSPVYKLTRPTGRIPGNRSYRTRSEIVNFLADDGE